MEKVNTTVDGDILAAFRHVIFKRRGDIQKGDISKAYEEAMLLYVQHMSKCRRASP